MNNSNITVVVGAATSVICSLLVTFATTAIAHLELTYARWTRVVTQVPALVGVFKEIYGGVWLLPIGTAIVAYCVVGKRIVRPEIAVSCISALVILHVVWFFFWLLALYLANQSFVSGQ